MLFAVELNGENNNVSKNLFEALKSRINQRRQKDIVGLLKYLHNPDFFNTNALTTYLFTSSELEYPLKNELPGIERKLFIRLFLPTCYVEGTVDGG